METSTANLKPVKEKADERLPSRDLLALQIRKLIADKEFVTATANMDLARGGEWRCDYGSWHGAIDAEINDLFCQANEKGHGPREREDHE